MSTPEELKAKSQLAAKTAETKEVKKDIPKEVKKDIPKEDTITNEELKKRDAKLGFKTLTPLEKRQEKILEKAKTKAYDKVQKTFKLDNDTVFALDKMIEVANEKGEATTSMTSLVQFILDDFLGIQK